MSKTIYFKDFASDRLCYTHTPRRKSLMTVAAIIKQPTCKSYFIDFNNIVTSRPIARVLKALRKV